MQVEHRLQGLETTKDPSKLLILRQRIGMSVPTFFRKKGGSGAPASDIVERHSSDSLGSYLQLAPPCPRWYLPYKSTLSHDITVHRGDKMYEYGPNICSLVVVSYGGQSGEKNKVDVHDMPFHPVSLSETLKHQEEEDLDHPMDLPHRFQDYWNKQTSIPAKIFLSQNRVGGSAMDSMGYSNLQISGPLLQEQLLAHGVVVERTMPPLMELGIFGGFETLEPVFSCKVKFLPVFRILKTQILMLESSVNQSRFPSLRR